ncbi:porin [Pseudooceanicola lipolyticus]|uniref:Porin n=1 Tax=Pseudooceanicola lipolyticus TaxID=2029104 RepID=A0A2M8IZF2_9RHOB|nr:porin [Pseudooceanicola lipolyticus]PJE35874.1 porin [Pseudooceanicola lipolyticus]
MKKVLFATTALIATASMAAADVRISGYGRFGLDYNDRNASSGTNGIGAPANGISETTLTSRLRLQFDMSTETDGGVTLGARARVNYDSRDNVPTGGNGFNGARFYATVGGFTLGVGNIIGALEGMSGLYLETRTAGIGIDGAGFHSVVTNVNNTFFDWDAYSSGGAGVNGVEVLYSSGPFSGHISYSKRNDSTVNPGVGNGAAGAPARTAVNLAYTFGDWTASLGHQSSDIVGEDKTAIAVFGDLGAFGVRVAYADNDGIDKFGLYGNMDIGAASNIVLFVTSEDAADAGAIAQGRDNRDVTAGNDTGGEGESYGIHYSYDLGGGASFEAGAVRSSNDQTQVQAGVYFSF